MRTVEVVVHGRVQGVFFRASTRDLARRLGVRGWVHNDASGTVTMHLQGDDEAVTQVIQWARDGGPEHARVDDVEVSSIDPDADLEDFSIRQ